MPGHFRATFVTGLVVTVPVVATFLALRFLFRSLDGLLGPTVAELTGREVPGLGLLATLVTINAPGVIHGQRVKAAKQNIARLISAVDMYYVEVGKYPQDLNSLVSAGGEGGTELKIIKKVPKDPWGNDFAYKLPGLHGEDYSIVSYGADGMEGGDNRNADISSWDLEESDENP